MTRLQIYKKVLDASYADLRPWSEQNGNAPTMILTDNMLSMLKSTSVSAWKIEVYEE